jgi:pyruvate carboxylase
MLSGSLGEPDGGWPEKIQTAVLRGTKAKPGRPGEHLEPIDLTQAAVVLEKKVGHKISQADLMSYLMYPDVFLKFSKTRSQFGSVDVLPTPAFFYGLQTAEEIAVELEPGKILSIKLLTVGDPQPDGTRTIFYELNGQPREVTIRDRSRKAAVPSRAKADPGQAGQVGAPIPGAISSISVELGQTVAKGDRLLVMEAMKMQSTIYAPVGGKILEKLVSAGDKVDAKDLLLVIG